MTNLQDNSIRPTIEELAEYINNPLFLQFCSQIKALYACPDFQTVPLLYRNSIGRPGKVTAKDGL